jgi:hypothetical protein
MRLILDCQALWKEGHAVGILSCKKAGNYAQDLPHFRFPIGVY